MQKCPNEAKNGAKNLENGNSKFENRNSKIAGWRRLRVLGSLRIFPGPRPDFSLSPRERAGPRCGPLLNPWITVFGYACSAWQSSGAADQIGTPQDDNGAGRWVKLETGKWKLEIGCWCYLEWRPTRAGGHSRESGNPVRRQHISKDSRSRFPLSRE